MIRASLLALFSTLIINVAFVAKNSYHWAVTRGAVKVKLETIEKLPQV